MNTVKTEELIEKERILASEMDVLYRGLKALQDHKRNLLADLEHRAQRAEHHCEYHTRGKPNPVEQEKILLKAGASVAVARRIVCRAEDVWQGSVSTALEDAVTGTLGPEACRFARGLSNEAFKALKKAVLEAVTPVSAEEVRAAQAKRDAELKALSEASERICAQLDRQIAEAQSKIDARKEEVVAMREEVFAELDRLAQQIGKRAERITETHGRIEGYGEFTWRADRGWGWERVVRRENNNDDINDWCTPSHREERIWYSKLSAFSQDVQMRLDQRRKEDLEAAAQAAAVAKAEAELRPVVDEILRTLYSCDSVSDYYFETWVYNHSRDYGVYDRDYIRKAVILYGGQPLKAHWFAAASRYIREGWKKAKPHRRYGWVNVPQKPGRDTALLAVWEQCRAERENPSDADKEPQVSICPQPFVEQPDEAPVDQPKQKNGLNSLGALLSKIGL